MLEVVISTAFHRDVKRMVKRGKNIEKLKYIINLLKSQEALHPKYCDHNLSGKYNGHRKCHVEPNWLLIYRIIDGIIRFERTGSHPDLFE